jgi:hypothetical protein
MWQKIEAYVPKDYESEQRKIALPERTQRMESYELGYQVVREPLAPAADCENK